MHCLPVAHVSGPDTVQLSGRTTLKTVKALYNWTVSDFNIVPNGTDNIRSPVFSHPNLSKWCVELENHFGPLMCFQLVASNDSQPVDATIKALVLDRNGAKHCVYPPNIHCLAINGRSTLVSMNKYFDTKELGKDWTFECEVCTVEVVTEDTSEAAKEEMQSTLSENLECLLDSKDLADITLSAGGVCLEAHRAIMCARSPVFRAMLSHDTKEARESLVEIQDVGPEVVSEMLRYMYTDRLQVPSDMAEQLLVAADKYGLQDAKLMCELELVKQLTVDRAADIAVFAILHSCSFLQKVCASFIKQNLEQVASSRGWVNIIEKCPQAVKTISQLVTGGSERCSSLPAMTGPQSDSTTGNSPIVESVSEYCTSATSAVSSDTVWDFGYTRCERKELVYVWTVSGLTNWPQDRDFVASPRFCHPETVQWEVRLNKLETKYHVSFHLLQNKSGGNVIVDQSVAVISPEGQKHMIHMSLCCKYEDDEQYDDDFECGELVDDMLTVECQIDMLLAIQQCVGAIKPMLQSNLLQDLNSLLESGNFADFKLRAGIVEKSAHRAILAARSPIFARMLQPGSEVLKKGLLEVPDMKPKVLTEVLHYMYTGKVKNLCDSTELLAAAHRFEMSDLKKECVTRLSRHLTVGNAVATAICAVENECDTLLNLSAGFIRSHLQQVMGTAEWMEAIDKHPETLARIFQLEVELGR